MTPIETSLPAEQRKRLLVVRGALYRAALIESQQVVSANLHADVLVKSAFSHVAGSGGNFARQLFSLDALSSGKVAMLLPVLAQAYQLVGRRTLIKAALSKPVLIAGAVLGTAGGLALMLKRRRDQKREAQRQVQQAMKESAANGESARSLPSVGVSLSLPEA